MSAVARLVLILSALVVAASASAESLKGRYFMVVWAYQGESNHPVDAHTFASFYRGDDLPRGASNPLTISWLPATGVVQLFGQERGRNFSLQETLRLARSRGYRLGAYGPYEIKAELYQRAQDRVRVLTSGRFAYTMLNGPADAINCIAAVGEIGGPIFTGLNYGLAASFDVAEHLAAWMPAYPRVEQRVADILKIDSIIDRKQDSVQQLYSERDRSPVETVQP
jgi:hypothetical protein